MSPEQRNVDEWFARHEEELLRQARRERERGERETSAREEKDRRRELREAHWMKCPKCGHDLEEMEISEVKIDRCTSCEGIFLDRGELETIMLQRSEDRRGFFRRLIGFGPDQSRAE